jgi:hypothetical protein
MSDRTKFRSGFTVRAGLTGRATRSSFLFLFWTMRSNSLWLRRGVRHSANYLVAPFGNLSIREVFFFRHALSLAK